MLTAAVTVSSGTHSVRRPTSGRHVIPDPSSSEKAVQPGRGHPDLQAAHSLNAPGQPISLALRARPALRLRAKVGQEPDDR